MSKEFRLIKPEEFAEVTLPPVDWNLCILCQTISPEPLTQPWKGTGKGKSGTKVSGYLSFATNLVKFKELGKIPLNVVPEQFDDGSGIKETLQTHRAMWHKSCRQLFSNTMLDRRRKRASEQDIDNSCPSPVKLRRFCGEVAHSTGQALCFFCDREAGTAILHDVTPMGMDQTVRMYATELGDTLLLAKLSPGDMVALGAKYHKTCLCDLYNRFKQMTKQGLQSSTDNQDSSYKSIALAELISYIGERRLNETTVPVFRLADLTSVYKDRLEELNPENTEKVNSTRLKERLLLHCPYLTAAKKGRDVLLTYDTAIGDAILIACSNNDSEALQLARTAVIIRKQLFSHGRKFSGSLVNDESTVPDKLSTLVNMILHGPSIKTHTQEEGPSTRGAKTICELIVYNSIHGDRVRKENVRHNSDREVPVPVYLGLKVHAKTRSQELIDRLHQHGLSISYDRVLRISCSIASSIIKRFEDDGVVCPPQLKKGLFTTGQVDNIDHNPSATTAFDSFHGIAHSLCQHPIENNQGVVTDPVVPIELGTEKLPTTIALMPLFREVSHSFATIIHCMKTNQEATQILNPGQTPVLTMDQPLYALGKQIQWRFPEVYGEDKYVMMLGPLHIEMAGLKTLGDLLQGTGWCNAIAQAEIATKGTADSFIHASHVAKTRRAHQITASSLYILQRQAFNRETESVDHQDAFSEESFIEWCEQKSKLHPMFRFWSTVLDQELTLLAFVRAIRTSDFDLYVQVLSQLAPWFFALDHVHYSRWVSVHIRDMMKLHELCPDVHENFMLGAFTSNKTGNHYSAIGLDHAHEQMNAQVKGNGGAIGLTEDPGALRRWMVAGPHLSMIIGEYESSIDKPQVDINIKHHEQSSAQQKAFADDVRSLVAVMDELGNPFMDRTEDLLTINSQEIMPRSVVESIEQIHKIGERKYQTFAEERLMKNEKPISATISRTSLPLFRKPKHADPSKDKQKIMDLKSDCHLFSRLYIASQIREGDIQEFFKHENQKYPPSLSSAGNLRQGKKSDLVQCLQTAGNYTPSTATDAPCVDVSIMDGAALVHLIPIGESKTFADYANDILVPRMFSELNKTKRVDIVWDVYLKDSLKLSTRANRGTGTRKRVSSNAKLPGNWKNFLRNDANKDELFQFLGHKCVSRDTGDKVIISTLCGLCCYL